MRIPRVLVLGATGRIGAILRKCWPVGGIGGGIGADILWQTRHPIDGSGATTGCAVGESWVTLDPLIQPDALARAATGCSAILCLAGVVSEPDLGPDLGRNGRMDDNSALAEAAVRAGAAARAQVVLASSAAVYGNQPGVLTESASLAPMSDYGRAKVRMETRAAALAAELGVRVCALRIGNIAGIDAILGGWAPGFRLDQFADGRTPQRSYIGLRTLARVLGDLMVAKHLPGVLNIVSPGVIDMGALLDAADLAWEPRPAPQSAIAQLCLSTRALERFTSLQEASTDTLVAEWRALKEIT